MPYMNLPTGRVEVTCYNGVSNKGIPYQAREFDINIDKVLYNVSVHIYPKTTTVLVDKFAGQETSQGLFKFNTVIYKRYAPTLLDGVLLAARDDVGMVKMGGRVEQGLYTEPKDTRWDDDVIKADMLRVSNDMVNREADLDREYSRDSGEM